MADVNPATGKATIYMTSQAPHVHRTLFALVAGLPEQNIRIISPDLGGGFGNKVPIYPGYVVATAASLLIGRPVKWVEDRTGNLISTGFARDYHMHGELALKDGRITGLRVKMLSDKGAFFADAQPTKLQGRPVPHRHRLLRHPGGARGDRRRVHEQGAGRGRLPLLVPRHRGVVPDRAARADARPTSSGVDPAEIRLQNFIKPEQFPYTSATGFVYDSGDYTAAMNLALEKLGYEELRREQARGPRGGAAASGSASRPSPRSSAPGRGKHYDIAGLRMFDSRRAARAPHRQGGAQARRQVAGSGPRDDVRADRRRGARHPARGRQGAGGRHRQHAVRARHVRDPLDAGRRRGHGGDLAQARATRRKKIAAHLLEASEDDIEWEDGRSSSRARPTRRETIQDVAFAAYTNLPDGMEAGLEGVHYYDPPNMTYPVRHLRRASSRSTAAPAQWKVLRMVAVDDCGVRINPMIVEGQIMGGLTEGFAIAAMQLITFDEEGNCIGANFMDYLIPTAWETPAFELRRDRAPSPHHPIGAKGVGESATVGSPGRVRQRRRRRARARGRAQHRHAGDVRQGLGGAERGGAGRVNRADVLVQAGRLAAEGEPFVLATVVDVERPASARRGDRALVTADGALVGWIGGACSEPTVVREALRALADREPRLARDGGRSAPRRVSSRCCRAVSFPLRCWRSWGRAPPRARSPTSPARWVGASRPTACRVRTPLSSRRWVTGTRTF